MNIVCLLFPRCSFEKDVAKEMGDWKWFQDERLGARIHHHTSCDSILPLETTKTLNFRINSNLTGSQL